MLYSPHALVVMLMGQSALGKVPGGKLLLGPHEVLVVGS